MKRLAFTCILLVVFIEVKLDVQFMIEKDSIILEETGSQNSATLFQFVSKDFDQLGEDGELSNGWRDILLDIQEDAKNATQNIESTEMVYDSDSINKETEVSSGVTPNSNTGVAG